MTDAERVKYARELLEYRDRPMLEVELQTLRWLLAQAEAVARCRELAAEWENHSHKPSGPREYQRGFNAARGASVYYLRAALDGTAPNEGGDAP